MNADLNFDVGIYIDVRPVSSERRDLSEFGCGKLSVVYRLLDLMPAADRGTGLP